MKATPADKTTGIRKVPVSPRPAHLISKKDSLKSEPGKTIAGKPVAPALRREAREYAANITAEPFNSSDFPTLGSIRKEARRLREVVGNKEIEQSLSTLLTEIQCAKNWDRLTGTPGTFEQWCLKVGAHWGAIQGKIAVSAMKGEGRKRHRVWDIVETLMSDPEWKDAVHIAICTAARNKWLEQGGKKRGLLKVDTMVKQFKKMIHR